MQFADWCLIKAIAYEGTRRCREMPCSYYQHNLYISITMAHPTCSAEFTRSLLTALAKDVAFGTALSASFSIRLGLLVGGLRIDTSRHVLLRLLLSWGWDGVSIWRRAVVLARFLRMFSCLQARMEKGGSNDMVLRSLVAQESICARFRNWTAQMAGI